MTLIRKAIIDLNDLTRTTNVAMVDDMVDYYNRQTDKSEMRDSVVAKYGTAIKKSDNPADGEPLETYVRQSVKAQVDAGIITTLSSGFGAKIVNANATLFTERGQKYTLMHDSEDRDVEPASELLEWHRNQGGYNANQVSCDKLSLQVGSSAVFVSFARGHVMYQKFSPADVTVFFHDTITEDDETRMVDTSDIEDATAVRIRLSQVDSSTWNYLVICGRSTIWPQGRHVTYQDTEMGNTIPDFGAKGSIDWTPKGSKKPGNPLSVYANDNPDELNLPEYPLAIIQGCVTASGDVMPVYTSLYDDAKNIDVSTSHLLETGQKAATGALIFERTVVGRNSPLPTTDSGSIAVDSDTKVHREDSDSQATIDGIKGLNQLSTNTASGYSVPDYMAMSDFSEREAPSGEQLKVKTRPLRMFRNERIEKNRPAIRKIFAIEKIQIEMFAEGSDSEIALLKECSQLWDAGDLVLPENKKEKTERNIALRDAGGIDEIEFIRRENDLNSDEEAIDLYNKYADRAAEYPSIKAEPEAKQPLALPGRTPRV